MNTATKLLLAGTILTGCTVSSDARPRRATIPSVSIADVSASEENAVINFLLTRNSSAGSSSVTWRTVDGSAIAGQDYVAASGTVTFGSGETTQAISVRLIRSGATEARETFTVRLRAGTNIKVADSSATGTILDSADPSTPPVESTEDPPAAPEPTTQICSDGSVIPIGDTCPPETPARDPLLGEIDVASGFDFSLGLLSGGTIPGSAGADPKGAFRFICGAGQLLYEDPIVYPNGAGDHESHLHQFYGNTSANGDSTYASLRASGDSTCGSDGLGHAVNRSAYWMPAMFDGRGNVVKPDYVAIYYKRRSSSDPVCSNPPGTPVTPVVAGDQRFAMGQCVDLPNGLKFIFGYDMITATAPTGKLWYNCQGPGSVPGHYDNLAQVVGKCPAGATLGAVIEAPDCWDGKNLDSTNHRDHVAYGSYGDWGYYKCPSTHPYVIPAFTLGAWYSVKTGDSVGAYSLSSDAMHPELPKGTTFHADFFMAWDPNVKAIWHTNCINLRLNCSGGQLGDGRQIKRGDVPYYSGVSSWTNPTSRVPIP